MAAKLNKGELFVRGRCNGMGEIDATGSYVRLVYTNDLASYGLTISEGAASVLADELRGLTKTARFENVSCSHCGNSFGPGDHGFSHCDSHTGLRQTSN